MTDTSIRPRALDRGALVVTLFLGVAIVVTTAVAAIARIVEVLGNRTVPVAVHLADVPASVPVGPEGADVAVAVERAALTVSDLPAITVVALVLAAAVPAAAVMAATVFGSFAVRNILRGRAFSAANVGWVGGVVFALAVGFVLTWLFTSMGAHGAAAAVAGGPADIEPVPIDPPVILGIAALGVIAAAFQVGHRLQRETDGLV